MISHTFLYFIARVGNGVFAIATLATFTRLLSPEEYGIYALSMAITTVASAICFQWLNVVVGRFYPMHIDNPGKVISVAARGFCAAILAAALLFLGGLVFHEVLGLGPALVGILFLITIALGCHTLALQVANVQNDPVRYALLLWVKGGAALFLGIVLSEYGAGAEGVLLGLLAGLALAVVGFSPKPWIKKNTDYVNSHLVRQMFRYGMPLTLNFLAILSVDLADRFIIGRLLGAAHVASYAAAYDLVQQLVGPVMNILFLAAFPSIVKVYEGKGDEPVRIRLYALGSKLIAIGLPIAVGIGVLASDIAVIVFGPDYRLAAAELIPWLAAAIFVGAFKSYFLDLVFQLRHAIKYQGYIAIMMALVNIYLNLLLLPRYGVISAAWSTLVAFAAGALVSWLAGKPLFALPALGNVFWKSVGASVAMAGVLFLFSSISGTIWLLVKITLGFVTYASIAWALDIAGCRRLVATFNSWHVR